jgi:hypothetical protein
MSKLARLMEAEQSLEQREMAVRQALEKKHGGDPNKPIWIHVPATFADRVIYEWDGKIRQASYSIGLDGEVELGQPVEVVMSYTPVTEAVQIIEAVKDSDGREWDVILIEAGTSKNGNHYPAETLEAAVPLFEGAYAFADHATDEERRTRPERSVKDKVGRFSNVQFGQHEVGGRIVEGLKARFKVIAPWLREVLKEAVAMNEPDFLGFSVDVEGMVGRKEVGGRQVKLVERIVKVHSVDVVTDPAAGGRIVRLVASNRQEEGENMTPEQIKALIQEALKANQTELAAQLKAELASIVEAVKPKADDDLVTQVRKLQETQRLATQERAIDTALSATKLSETGRGLVRDSLVEAASRRDLTAEEITAAVQKQVTYEASLIENTVKPRHATAKILSMGVDKKVLALEGMFENADVKDADGAKVPRFRSLREAYCRFADVDPFELDGVSLYNAFRSNFDSHRDSKRVRESLTTASWADVFGDVMHKMALKTYSASPYQVWRKVVSSIESVADFQTHHFVRTGGYGDLTTVAEQATYPAMTSYDDEEVEVSVAKRGGIEDITMEMLVNDQIGKVRQIPQNLGRSAARTLYKFVMQLITTTNPTMDYDSVALYDAAHGNTGTAALSLTSVNAAIIAMRDQTAYGESLEILGARNYPRYILVPNELEQLANRIFKPSDRYLAMILDSSSGSSNGGTGIDPGSFANKGVEPIVVDFLTDASDWFLVANPAEVNTVIVAFLNGQEEPEMFVQDQPTVGSVFSADKISYKCRHIYGGDVADHRSFYRQVVA